MNQFWTTAFIISALLLDHINAFDTEKTSHRVNKLIMSNTANKEMNDDIELTNEFDQMTDNEEQISEINDDGYLPLQNGAQKFNTLGELNDLDNLNTASDQRRILDLLRLVERVLNKQSSIRRELAYQDKNQDILLRHEKIHNKIQRFNEQIKWILQVMNKFLANNKHWRGFFQGDNEIIGVVITPDNVHNFLLLPDYKYKVVIIPIKSSYNIAFSRAAIHPHNNSEVINNNNEYFEIHRAASPNKNSQVKSRRNITFPYKFIPIASKKAKSDDGFKSIFERFRKT